MSFGVSPTALTSLTVTQNTLFPCSEASARNEITAANLLTGLSVLTAVPTDPASVSWVCRVRADDIAGSDGAAITSFSSIDSNARAFTGTGTLKTGANGINGHNVLRFNGSSNTFTTTAGGASLTGDWYAAAVVKWNSLSGFQNVLSWGDQATGKRRSMLKYDSALSPNNVHSFIGELADVPGSVAIANATTYLLEMAYSATTGLVTLWVNGVRTACQQPASNNVYATLAAYTSAVLRLGAPPSGSSEFLNADVAEAVWLGSFSAAAQDGFRSYCASRYGLSLSHAGYYPALSGSAATAAPSALYESGGCTVLGGTSPLLTPAGTGVAITKSAVMSVYGTLAADCVVGQHIFSNSWALQNTLAVWNKSSTGYSAVTFQLPGSSNGQEMSAIGEAYVNSFPWGGPNGSFYLEASNFKTSSLYGDFRIIQTKASGNNYKMRKRIRDDTQAIEEYDLTAAEPSVSGATTGLVSLRGLPPTSVANNGTVNTNITTGATQCGLVVVKDATSSRCAVYRLENTTLTAVSANAIFSTTSGNASTVNVYNSSGQIQIENKIGGALSLTAAYYGA